MQPGAMTSRAWLTHLELTEFFKIFAKIKGLLMAAVLIKLHWSELHSLTCHVMWEQAQFFRWVNNRGSNFRWAPVTLTIPRQFIRSLGAIHRAFRSRIHVKSKPKSHQINFMLRIKTIFLLKTKHRKLSSQKVILSFPSFSFLLVSRPTLHPARLTF